MEDEKTCQDCSFYMQDSADTDYGVCFEDPEFEPYAETIIENDSFKCCYDLYLKKRFIGYQNICDKFEEIEELKLPESMSLEEYLRLERRQYTDVSELNQYLYGENGENIIAVKNTLSFISKYVYSKNESAYKTLVNYYKSLGPAETLSDVNIRIRIIDLLSIYESRYDTAKALVYELERSISNNTTRRLYTLILDILKKYPKDMIDELIQDVLKKKDFSYKIRKRIKDVLVEDQGISDYYFFADIYSND